VTNNKFLVFRWSFVAQLSGFSDPIFVFFLCFFCVLNRRDPFISFVHAYNGDEFWIGYGGYIMIERGLDAISKLKTALSDDIDEDERVSSKKASLDKAYNIHISASYSCDNSLERKENALRKFDDYLKEKKILSSTKEKVRQELMKSDYQVQFDYQYQLIFRTRNKLHYIATQFLARWKLIAMPRFDLHNIIKKGGNLSKKQKTILSYLAHCKMMDRLITTCSIHGGELAQVTEAYSSKDCSFCGARNSPGRSRLYHCRCCKRTMTRDGNAALNIFKMAFATVYMYLHGLDPYPWPDDDYNPDADDGGDSGDEDEPPDPGDDGDVWPGYDSMPWDGNDPPGVDPDKDSDTSWNTLDFTRIERSNIIIKRQRTNGYRSSAV